MRLTRRLFVRWSAAVSALLTALPRRLPSQGRSQTAPRELPGLESRALLPVADVVLPAELGAARIERATAAFARWIAAYRPGEETLHPYGSSRLGVTGPSPAGRWRDQLASLDTEARRVRGRAFAALTRDERAGMVRTALSAAQSGARVGSPLAAPHVALALLAHFLETAEARNLAFGRTIDPRTCRPLADSPREPVVLRRAGGTS